MSKRDRISGVGRWACGAKYRLRQRGNRFYIVIEGSNKKFPISKSALRAVARDEYEHDMYFYLSTVALPVYAPFVNQALYADGDDPSRRWVRAARKRLKEMGYDWKTF